MSIEIKAVTKDNRAAMLALHVNESQTSYIESTEQCLKEADDVL
ncbi:spermidine acetyltransferase, partial [Bacillus atrophaeus]|nr:spermidine acetyltransferase [Bacillus atrophaeus]